MGLNPKISTGDKFQIVIFGDLPEKHYQTFLEHYMECGNDCFILHTVFSNLNSDDWFDELDTYLCETFGLNKLDSILIELYME